MSENFDVVGLPPGPARGRWLATLLFAEGMSAAAFVERFPTRGLKAVADRVGRLKTDGPISPQLASLLQRGATGSTPR